MKIKTRLDINLNNIDKIKKFKAGTWITYTGKLFTMRDATHTKMLNLYEQTGNLPFDLKNSIILYAAPTNGEKIIIGPTTSIRMDTFLEFIFQQGVVATIGKGKRSLEAINIIKKYKSPYFVLLSGVSAYLSDFFIKEKIVAFHELGPEALREYEVVNLPLLVGIDTEGNTI